MKKIYFKDWGLKFLILTAMGCGFLLFQGQNSNDEPVTDHWRLPDYIDNSGGYHPVEPFVVVTTPDGYDNFNMGIDNAESTIQVHPNNPTWFATGWNGNPLGIAGTHHTENGYDPWAINNPPISTLGDPWMAYDSLGNLFFINFNNSGSSTYVVKSTNNGTTWTGPVTGCNGFDRMSIAADQTGGPYKNYVYCGETTSGGASFARSTDNGASFQTITTLTPHNLPGFMCCVGPNGGIQGGSVYVVTYSGSNANGTYNFHRSTDGGTSFTYMSAIPSIGIIGIEIGGRSTINAIRTRPYPMIAADNSYGPNRGRLYVVYANNPGGVNGLKPDIWLRYSTDFGSTWAAAVRVNDNANPELSDEWFPAVWCDKQDNGKLYIKWYGDQEGPGTYLTSVYGTYTTTGGTSFAPSQKISNQPFPYPNVGPCSGCVSNYRGDYDAIVGNGKTSMSAWFDGRSATWASYSAYFPDFALTVIPSTHNMSGINDSDFSYCRVPSVKLYTDKVKFTATVNPPPGTGTIAVSFLNKSTPALQDSLTTYPDSLRVRIRCTGGVTSGSYTVAVWGKGSNGTPVHVRNISLSVLTGISQIGNEVPNSYYLYQNYPNPFNPATNIRFDVAKTGHVKLVVYDITGKQVAELVNSTYNAGKYIVDFKPTDISSGIYFYKIETPEFVSVKRMILVK